MRTLVTGGAGFIGSHLVADLVRRGAAVTVLDNLRRGHKQALAHCLTAIDFIEGDIRDPRTVRDAIQGADIVFHLAAQSSVMTAHADTNYTLSTNIEGTRNVLEAARAEKAGRIVFTSSREVYGDPEHLPVPETAPLNPKNTYGISKVRGEALCREFQLASEKDRLDIAIVRLANVYGPGDSDRVMPLFLDAALDGRPLTLFGGQQVIDFVWIDVVVDALIRVATGPLIDGPANIGSGKGTTVAELARRVVAATGSKSPIEIAPAREIEVSRFIAGVAKAQRTLGLDPPADPLLSSRRWC